MTKRISLKNQQLQLIRNQNSSQSGVDSSAPNRGEHISLEYSLKPQFYAEIEEYDRRDDGNMTLEDDCDESFASEYNNLNQSNSSAIRMRGEKNNNFGFGNNGDSTYRMNEDSMLGLEQDKVSDCDNAWP